MGIAQECGSLPLARQYATIYDVTYYMKLTMMLMLSLILFRPELCVVQLAYNFSQIKCLNTISRLTKKVA